MLQVLFIFLLFHRSTIHTLECYYCNDEEGYYCPQPFPLKSMFSNNKNYNEQMKNIAVSSGNKLLSETIINCFKTNYYNSNYEYQNSYRGVIKISMNNSIICQSNYRLSQNPNYPGWEKTFCCNQNRCNQAQSIFLHIILIPFSIIHSFIDKLCHF